MQQPCRPLALVVGFLVCTVLQARLATAQINEFLAAATRSVGQSDSDSSSTTVAADPSGGVDPARNSVTARVGFNINADAGPGLFAAEVGLASFEVAFAVVHTQRYDLLFDFRIQGQLLRVTDDAGCTGSISSNDVSIPKVVRMSDGAEFPLDVVLRGDSLDIGDVTAGTTVSAEDSKALSFSNQAVGVDVYRMSFQAGGTAISGSCEVSARFGAANGSTTQCEACEYPGAFDRSLADDGIFVTATVIDHCGDGVQDSGEECDLGADNGKDTSCCDRSCQFAFARICRPAASDCDQPEVCTTTSGLCPDDQPRAAGSPCASDDNFCNGEERCDAAGACSVHANPPCSGTQTCDELGQVCVARPPLLVTNDADDGAGSLRIAMGAANLGAGADLINFDPTFFSVPRTIRLEGSLPAINDDVTIDGPGAHLLTIAGDGQDRVFTISGGKRVNLNGMTITGGNAGAEAGGGVLNGGALTITNSHITGNTAASGGGISDAPESGPSLRLQQSTVSRNTATGAAAGGGVSSQTDVIITNSTISGNTAAGGGDNGGGLRLASGTIENSTIADNGAAGSDSAGGLRVSPGTVTLRNTIIAANHGAGAGNLVAGQPDVSAADDQGVESQGFNLIGDPGRLSFNGTNDQSGTSAAPLLALLAPLAPNGGATPTHALLAGSPAIDTGFSSGAKTDQRGVPRPLDDPAIQNAPAGDGADIGAFERGVPQTPEICTGDCNTDGEVGIDELMRAVDIALGNGLLPPCLIGDKDGDGSVTVGEIISAIGNAATRCPS